MLKETYLANMKKLPRDAIKIVVTRSAGHILSPSKKLLRDYKDRSIDWNEYIRRFTLEMDNDACKDAMREIKLIAENQDVYLICYEKEYPCHRFLLIDMINKLD